MRRCWSGGILCESKSSATVFRHQVQCCLPLLVLDLALDIVDRVRALHLESDGLAGERLYEDLHDWQ